jgi:capsular exopolysaccharide synthesis family protein
VRAEAFRTMRTNLQFDDVDHELGSVVITSSIAGEGKSTTCCNLAISLAQAGTRVILVEADLRRPKVADYMGLEGAIGLTNVLVGNLHIDDALQAWGNGNLHVLASGQLPPNPSELLGSQQMEHLLRELEGRADIVLIDAPPILPVTDAAVLSVMTSGVVMVVSAEKTRRDQVKRAASGITGVGGVILGTVFNKVPKRGAESYGYGYGYGYYGQGTKPSMTPISGPVIDPPQQQEPIDA